MKCQRNFCSYVTLVIFLSTFHDNIKCFVIFLVHSCNLYNLTWENSYCNFFNRNDVSCSHLHWFKVNNDKFWFCTYIYTYITNVLWIFDFADIFCFFFGIGLSFKLFTTELSLLKVTYHIILYHILWGKSLFNFHFILFSPIVFSCFYFSSHWRLHDQRRINF
jgi:hypothetical protein